jgi:hypothetical protein
VAWELGPASPPQSHPGRKPQSKNDLRILIRQYYAGNTEGLQRGLDSVGGGLQSTVGLISFNSSFSYPRLYLPGLLHSDQRLLSSPYLPGYEINERNEIRSRRSRIG